ncbi:hypothetical protein Sjap_000360 [Stephania japonica]|uniref:SP-RING-type domain-containing protein n=1 Tax=Stephania japonica TaxID=461633 RepID=A0AAP0KKG8_9MAGN
MHSLIKNVVFRPLTDDDKSVGSPGVVEFVLTRTIEKMRDTNNATSDDTRKRYNLENMFDVIYKDNNPSMQVKELEDGVAELLAESDGCLHFSSAIESVANNYQPVEGASLPLFKLKLYDFSVEFITLSSHCYGFPIEFLNTLSQNVHHAGQPMPGDEQEDILVTSTQTNLLNIICPLSGKPITKLGDPVRNMDCKHIYEKMAVMHYIKAKKAQKCPVAGCPKILQAGRIVCDPLLRIEIDEMCSMGHQTGRSVPVEDFTELDEDD